MTREPEYEMRLESEVEDHEEFRHPNARDWYPGDRQFVGKDRWVEVRVKAEPEPEGVWVTPPGHARSVLVTTPSRMVGRNDLANWEWIDPARNRWVTVTDPLLVGYPVIVRPVA